MNAERELILGVDDDESNRLVLDPVLRTFGNYDTLIACGGAEALDLVAQSPRMIVAAVVDVSMPVMNGEELVIRLRSLYPRLPVCFCTAHVDFVPQQVQLDALTIVQHKPIMDFSLFCTAIAEMIEAARHA